MAAGKLLPYINYLLYTAQTSGMQKGLQSFTVQQNPEQKENYMHNQSRPHRMDSLDSGVQSFESGAESVRSGLQTLDSGIQSFDSTGSQTKLKRTDSAVSLPNYEILQNKETTEVFKDQGKLSVAPNYGKSMAKAGEPMFLNEYYSNSRLHFLSTWKAEFKSYVNELQSKGSNFHGREELRKIVHSRETTDEYGRVSKGGTPQRCVMHVDMDSFFVSVGLRKRPDLKGKTNSVS